MFSELEEEIEQLEGVISCKITGKEKDEKEKIDEIHIVASQNRQPKRIVRDIETITLVDLDQKISHKKISIAQINSDGQNSSRNRIELISIHKENSSSTCHLKIKVNNNLIEETIEEEPGRSLPFAIAEGLIKTIKKYINLKEKLRVENIFTTGLNNEIIIVQLVLFKDGQFSGEQRLIGSTYVNHNLPLATGKACLKALNRQVSSYI